MSEHPDPTVALCAAWLAIDDEILRLQAAWGREEGRLMRTRAWMRMTPDERDVSPQGAALRALDERIEAEYARLDALYDPIPGARVTTPGAAAAKLNVALRLMQRDSDGDCQDLAISVARDLEAMAGSH